MEKKSMNTEAYLEYLTREEHRSRLLAELATTPAEKRAAKRENARLKKVMKYVRKLAGAGIETADAKTNMIQEDVE